MTVPALITYAACTEIISANAQAQVIAKINQLRNSIPDPTAGTSASHPDWDQLHPRMAEQLRAELLAITVAIDAAPTA